MVVCESLLLNDKGCWNTGDATNKLRWHWDCLFINICWSYISAVSRITSVLLNYLSSLHVAQHFVAWDLFSTDCVFPEWEKLQRYSAIKTPTVHFGCLFCVNHSFLQCLMQLGSWMFKWLFKERQNNAPCLQKNNLLYIFCCCCKICISLIRKGHIYQHCQRLIVPAVKV